MDRVRGPRGILDQDHHAFLALKLREVLRDKWCDDCIRARKRRDGIERQADKEQGPRYFLHGRHLLGARWQLLQPVLEAYRAELSFAERNEGALLHKPAEIACLRISHDLARAPTAFR